MQPNPKTTPRTFRLTGDESALMDTLAERLATPGVAFTHADVLRVALRHLAESKGIPTPEARAKAKRK